MSGTWYRRGVVALTLLLASILTLWALITPGFRAPDEPHHFNSVMRVATGGGWPEPGAALISGGTLIATREAGFSRPDQNLGLFTASVLPRGTLRGWGLDFAQIVPLAPEDRSVLDYSADPDLGVEPAVDQMTQHPPLYYGIAAGVVRALGALDWRWDQQLLLLRLLNCLIAALSVPLVAATARRLTASPTVALAAAAGVVSVGQFAHINSSVTNDTLTTFFGLGVTYLVARVMTGRHRPALPVVTGVLLGLGLLTKGFMLAGIPLVALAFIVGGRDSRPRSKRLISALVALGTAFAVGGWWWLRNLVVYGALQPPALPPLNVDWGDQTPTLSEYFPEALTRLNTSFWAKFGWLELPLPWAPGITQTLGIGFVVLVISALFVRSRIRIPLLVLLTFPLGTLGIILYGGATSFYETGLFGGHQGRYMYTTIAVLMTMAAFSVCAVTSRLWPKLLPIVPVAAASLATASAAYALYIAFQGFYQPLDQSAIDALVRWDSWSALGRPGIAVAVLSPVLFAALAIFVLSRAAVAANHAQEEPDSELGRPAKSSA